MSAYENPSRPITIVAESAVLDLHGFLRQAFEQAAPQVQWLSASDVTDPAQVDVALCWYAPSGSLERYSNLRLVQSLAAGADHLLAAVEGLPETLPLCRIVDDTMAHAMSAYVAWAVLNRQRSFQNYVEQNPLALWKREPITPAREHRVGIAGLGNLGLASARTLLSLGYQVRGWSRTAKQDLPDALQCFVGDAQLGDFLQGCDTLVCLLPLTEQTAGFVNAKLLAQLPDGAHLVNAARGEHVVDADLLAALDSGRLSFATLDAFTVEPLPAESPYWQHPRVTVTPHTGARTSHRQVVEQTLDNLACLDAGRSPATLVVRSRGY